LVASAVIELALNSSSDCSFVGSKDRENQPSAFHSLRLVPLFVVELVESLNTGFVLVEKGTTVRDRVGFLVEPDNASLYRTGLRLTRLGCEIFITVVGSSRFGHAILLSSTSYVLDL